MVCAICGGPLFGNPHRIAAYLNAALWLTLGAALYGAFAKVSVVFVGASAMTFGVVAVVHWYVATRALGDRPAFRAR